MQALVWNVGTCRCDAKRAIQAEHVRKNLSIDAEHRDGAARSSVEALVMSVERRGCVIQLKLIHQPEMGGMK